jgi:vitamin B12 transporter
MRNQQMRISGSIASRAALIAICIGIMISINTLWANSSAEETSARRTVSGKVLDPKGAALPRTLIEVRDGQGQTVATTQTNGRGEYSLNLPQGKYTLKVTLAGFAPVTHPLDTASSDAAADITLPIASPQELVVVTATKTETPLVQVGSSVSVVTGEELSEKGIASVAEAMREVAGIAVVQSGGIGKTTSLFMRGGESDYTKILIDGIPVNEPGGSYNLGNLSTSSIDRIEVVRGPQSALYGSDAIAGVIQIFTKRGKSEGLSPKPFAMVEGGSFATYRYGGGIEGSSERLDYRVSFSRFDTDNNVANDSFNEASITGNLGLRISKKAEMRVVFRSEAGRSGSPGPWAFERPDLDAYYRRRDEAGAITLTYLQTPSWTQRVSYTINDSRQYSANPLDSGSYTPRYKDRIAPFPYTDYTFENLNQTRRHKASYQSDLLIPFGNLFSFGFDYEHESGVVGDPSLNPAEVSRVNNSGYLQDQWALKNRFFLTGGIRFDNNESFGFYASPRLSASFLARQSGAKSAWGTTKIKANFGMGIKEPTLLESFSTSIYFQGNPDLKPEKTTSFDVGIEQQFNSNRGVIEWTYFENRFRDQIGYEITDYSTYAGSFFNIGKTKARGIEISAKHGLFWNLAVSGAYTFLDSEIVDSVSAFDPAFAKGQELFRRPRHSGNLDLRWKFRKFGLGATGILVGSRVDSDYSDLGMTRNDGYSLLNLIANMKLTKDISIFAAVNNVANERYMEVLGYPALRRNFRIGLRAGF